MATTNNATKTTKLGDPVAVAHDERLVELWTAEARAAAVVRAARSDYERAVKLGRPVCGPPVDLDRILQEALAAVSAAVSVRSLHEHGYTGWARYFYVTNTGGHIHSSTGCSTCYPSTEFRFLTEISGLDRGAAVDLIGPVLCSVCFPDAPVELTVGVSHATTAAKAERAEAAARRRAKRLDAALIEGDPDASIRVGPRDRLSTIRAANMWLTDAFEWGPGHPSFPASDVAAVAEAVAVRTGTTADVVLDAAKVRAAKRK